MLKLQSGADYHERRRELMALEEIVDDGVALIAKSRQHVELRPGLQLSLEGFGEALVRLLDRYLDAPLTLRREALRLYEDVHCQSGFHGSANAGAFPSSVPLERHNEKPFNRQGGFAP